MRAASFFGTACSTGDSPGSVSVLTAKCGPFVSMDLSEQSANTLGFQNTKKFQWKIPEGLETAFFRDKKKHKRNTFWCGRPRFLLRTSMTRRFLEELCPKKVCVGFLVPTFGESSRGNTIRRNRAESLREESLPLRGSLRGSLEGPPKNSERYIGNKDWVTKRTSQMSSEVLSWNLILHRKFQSRSKISIPVFLFAGPPSVPKRARSKIAIHDRLGHTPRGSCNRTLLRRFLRRFSNSKCFLEGLLEGTL